MPGKFDLPSALSVYLLADCSLAARCGRPLLDAVERAIEGGVTALQLRAKDSPAIEQWEVGKRLRELAASAGIPFFVNDRVDLALALDADGVHLGEEDIPVAAARRLALAASRPDFIIGFSTALLRFARQAVADGADYVSVGNLFGTATKPDAGDPIGLAPLADIARQVGVPVIGIGGIDEQNASSVIEAGGVGVAVASYVIASADPRAAARALARAVEQAKRRRAAADGPAQERQSRAVADGSVLEWQLRAATGSSAQEQQSWAAAEGRPAVEAPPAVEGRPGPEGGPLAGGGAAG